MIENDVIIIKIAELNVQVRSKYDFIIKKCADFEAELPACPDIIAQASPEEIADEKKPGDQSFSDVYCEFVCIYRTIAEKLPFFDGLVFHGAAIEAGGKAYVFTAPSGTGKSTHIKLWMDCFGEQVRVINGDKPIMRKRDDKFVVYSTPWAGKESWYNNLSAPLDAICLIRRGKENKIYPINPSEYFEALMGQVYVPKDSEAWLKTLSLIDELAQKTRFYLLECDVSREAAELSFKTLTN